MQISLVLAFALLFVLNVRSPSVDRTYKVSLAMELIILGLWIPPTYAISKSLTTDPPQSTVVTLSFCGINLYVLPRPALRSPSDSVDITDEEGKIKDLPPHERNW